jgi:hypothetical protein
MLINACIRVCKRVSKFTHFYQHGNNFKHAWEKEKEEDEGEDEEEAEEEATPRFGKGWSPMGPGVVMVGNNTRVPYDNPWSYSDQVESMLEVVHGVVARRELRAWSQVRSIISFVHGFGLL